MATRDAICSRGQLRLTAEGDPIRISMCHCLACQRRTGSAFGIQARFPSNRVRFEGRHSEYVRTSDDGGKCTFHFCPDCGATAFYTPRVTARCRCGSDRRLRRTRLPATDHFGVRVASASVAGATCRDGTSRLKARLRRASASAATTTRRRPGLRRRRGSRSGDRPRSGCRCRRPRTTARAGRARRRREPTSASASST